MKKRLKTGTIVLLKPNFLTCTFNKSITGKYASVILLGQEMQVRMKDIVLAKLPVYKKVNSNLEFYHKRLNKWVICQLIQINEQEKVYEIQ